MSAIYWRRENAKNARLIACDTLSPLLTYCRLNGVHWRWDDSAQCYQTHRWTSDARATDVRPWPSDTALSSFLRAVREDDRLAGDPLVRLMALYITLEYVTSLL